MNYSKDIEFDGLLNLVGSGDIFSQVNSQFGGNISFAGRKSK